MNEINPKSWSWTIEQIDSDYIYIIQDENNKKLMLIPSSNLDSEKYLNEIVSSVNEHHSLTMDIDKLETENKNLNAEIINLKYLLREANEIIKLNKNNCKCEDCITTINKFLKQCSKYKFHPDVYTVYNINGVSIKDINQQIAILNQLKTNQTIKLIDEFIAKLKQKYPMIDLSYSNNFEQGYDIIYTNADLYDDEDFYTFSGGLIREIFYENNLYNISFYFDYEKLLEKQKLLQNKEQQFDKAEYYENKYNMLMLEHKLLQDKLEELED